MIDKKILRSLFTTIFLDQTAITITFPLITLIFFDAQTRLFPADTSFAIRSFWYGLCMALPNIINIFFAPLLSALSDEFGRKKILTIEILGAVFFTLSLGLGVYTGTLALIFIGFIIRGAFCRTNPMALTIIGDTVGGDKKILYMSYLQCVISIGAFVGPILSGYIATRYFFPTLNFAFPFLVAAVIAMINTFLVSFLMRETLKNKQHETFKWRHLWAIKQVFFEKKVLAISFLLLLIQVSWCTYYQFMPPILKQLYHFNSHQLGLFMGMIAFWLAMATSIGMTILHRYFNPRQLIIASCYLLMIGFAITLAACENALPTAAIWVGMAPIAAGDVVAYSCLVGLYSNAVSPHHQGKVMGVSFIVVALTWAMMGFLGGVLMGVSPLLPIIIAPLGIVSALLILHGKMSERWTVSTAVT